MGLPSVVAMLEAEMMQHEQPSTDVVHYIANGLCVREVRMPAGMMAIGHYQKYEHLNVFLKGRVRIIDENTGEVSELSAPLMFLGKPGRKIGYIMEDTVWQNIYATDLTDPAEVERHFIDKAESSLTFYDASRPEYVDDGDYAAALADLGYTQDMVDAECLNDSDLIPFPFGAIPVMVAESAIQGKGLFATAKMQEGCLLAGRLNGKRTPAGRYVNHSRVPNVEAVNLNGDVYFRALRDIDGMRCGLLGEELTVDYRQAFRAARGG